MLCKSILWWIQVGFKRVCNVKFCLSLLILPIFHLKYKFLYTVTTFKEKTQLSSNAFQVVIVIIVS